MKRKFSIALLFCAVVCGTISAPAEAQLKPSRMALERQIVSAFERERVERALSLIDRYLRHWPNDSEMIYNAACGEALLGRPEAAADRLMDAVRAGFRDFSHMETDEDLASIRDHDVYLAILEARDRIEAAQPKPETPTPTTPRPSRDPRAGRGSEAYAEWQTAHPTGYSFQNDSPHRLHIASPLDERANNELIAMIGAQADQMAGSLFGQVQRDWVFLLVPAEADRSEFSLDQSTAGWYEHDNRMLVTVDIGASLRHEFAHVLHWGHMDLIGQRHPMWVQEGLASLYEEYRIDPSTNAIRFLPNERHNVVVDLIARNTAPSWRVLFSMKPVRFMRAAERNYPLVRSIFRFLADRDLVEVWYDHLVEGFSQDKSGIRAFEKTFGTSIDSVERDWKRWVRSRGVLDDSIDAGDASLGIQAEDAGDGCVVTMVHRRSGAADAGLQKGDVIVSIGRDVVRSTRELRLAVAKRRVGEVVLVRVRRGEQYLELSINLKAMPASIP